MFDRDTCFSLLGKSSTTIRPGVVQCHVQFEPPVGKITRIVLVSNDVVRAVHLPAFNFDRQALPGVTNIFDFTPVKTGAFASKWVRYRGLYHFEIFFTVRVVSPGTFHAWMSSAEPALGAAA
jgi:cytochrome c oxidase subunit 2